MGHALRGAAAAALALLAAGCFGREETIEIRPDGSAVVTYKVEGAREAVEGRPFLPRDAGWELVDRSDPAAGSDGDASRTWRARLARLGDYPGAFVRTGDPQGHLAPRMETHLEIRQQPGRTLYTFTRRYEGRRAGKFRELEEESGTAELLEQAEDSGLESLSDEDRRKLFSGLAEYEAAAMWLRTRDALGRAVLEGALDAADFTAATQRVEGFLQERLTGDYLAGFFSQGAPEQEVALGRLRSELRREVVRLMPARRTERILALLAEEERRFEITGEMSQDLYAVKVRLPGVVVASNAVSVEGGEVSWTFAGDRLLEGDLVLTATSVLER